MTDHDVNSPASRARRAYAREPHEWDYRGQLSREFLREFYRDWARIEEEITALQRTKRDMLATVRSSHGRHEADTLKITMRLILMSPRKREEQIRFNEAARRYVEMLENELVLRQRDA